MKLRWSLQRYAIERIYGKHGSVPASGFIKKRAHACTMLCVAWLGPDAFAAGAYFFGSQDSDRVWVATAIWIWRLHVIWIAICLTLWVFDRPKEVRFASERDEHGEHEQ
jgi:hypothetical protein